MDEDRPLIDQEYFPQLKSEVCHVTGLEGLTGIIKTKAILPNDGRFLCRYPSQSKRSISRKNGWVSLFDFDSCTRENCTLMERMWGGFFCDRTPVNVVIMLTRKIVADNLVPNIWARVNVGYGLGQPMFIPHVESWHKGQIPLSAVKFYLVLHGCGFERIENNISVRREVL